MANRVRVVFAIGAMHGGGSERQVVSLLRELDRDRFDPHLYLVYRRGPLLDQLPPDVRVAAFEDRCQTGRIYFPGRDHRQRVMDFAAYLREVQADVVYDRTFLMTLIAADGAQRVSVPNISTIVTDPSLGFKPVAGRFQSYKRRRLQRLYRNSTITLANSNGSARSAEAFYGLKPGSVVTHYNGVDLSVVRSTAQSEPDCDWWNAKGSETFRIVSAGRLNHEKGFHLLIDAAEQAARRISQRCRLVILGEGPHRDRLESQLVEKGLSDWVQLVGFQKNAAAWYNSADVFVLPSFLEGMPNVLLESMAVGTRVVSTDCPSGPAEILDGGRFGRLVSPGNVDDLSQALLEVFEARQSGSDAEMVQQARSHVESTFSIQIAARKLEELLLKAIGDR